MSPHEDEIVTASRPTRSRALTRLGFASALVLSLVACSDGGTEIASGSTPSSTAAVVDTPISDGQANLTQTTSAPTTMPPTTAAPTTIPAPSGGVFPGAEWATAALPSTVDVSALDAAVDTAFGAGDASSRVRSIVVVQGGAITYERYHPLDGPETIMESYSVAKSFTSAIIGMLVGDGVLAVDERAPVAAWDDPDDPRHAITVEHLLHMASGLEWTEEYGAGSLAQEMFGAEVASDVPAGVGLEAEPGTVFEYSTGTTAILAGIAIDALGGAENFDAYMNERLLDPLGITSTRFTKDRSGRWFGGFGADSTTRDFARFGLLYLNDGVWNGQRLLPEGWVDYSREPSPASEIYGAQWWMFRPGAFEARGLFGQIILVSQEHDLVIAINTTQGGDADTLVGTVYDLLTA